jgi:hypothetical protein
MTQLQEVESSRTISEFEQAGQEKELNLVQEFALFVVEERKWWLVPVLLVLGLASLMVVLGSTGVAPFIYTLF